jgi:hypothetical protein
VIGKHIAMRGQRHRCHRNHVRFILFSTYFVSYHSCPLGLRPQASGLSGQGLPLNFGNLRKTMYCRFHPLPRRMRCYSVSALAHLSLGLGAALRPGVLVPRLLFFHRLVVFLCLLFYPIIIFLRVCLRSLGTITLVPCLVPLALYIYSLFFFILISNLIGLLNLWIACHTSRRFMIMQA